MAQMLWQVWNYIDWGAEGRDQKDNKPVVSADKVQRRRQRAYMVGFLLIAFVKHMLNPYPTLHDLSIVSFLILMNITFVLKHVEAFVFLSFATFYGTITTWLMMILWLHRFSGNANFLFFQIIAMDTFLTLIFLQSYMGLDTKRKKYAQELLKPEDRKKPKDEVNTDSKEQKQSKVEATK